MATARGMTSKRSVFLLLHEQRGTQPDGPVALSPSIQATGTAEDGPFQKVLFPEGVTHGEGGFRTSKTSVTFGVLRVTRTREGERGVPDGI